MRLHLPWRNKEDDDNSGRLKEGRERIQEAVTAEVAAKKAVAEAQAREPQVQRLLSRVREMQQENHIGERVAKALRDGYGGDAHGSHGH